MGVYFNPSNIGFSYSKRSKIYVDKSGLISYTNSVLMTEQMYICVSRPRRFGKTMAAKMLTAYYSRNCDSKDLFKDLKIAQDPSFEEHLNHYNVIFLNIQQFLSESSGIEDMISNINSTVNGSILEVYPEIQRNSVKENITVILQRLFELTEIPIIFIIDEWDCIFREYKTDISTQRIYLDFLRNLLKDREYIGLAYMTGILPIKKYGTHSALNMFNEFSMTDPRELTEFTGFTKTEVINLCDKYQMDYDEVSRWYDGYSFRKVKSVYNPKSVVEALLSRHCNNYWSKTETYEALSIYFKTDYDGLKDTIIQLLAGEKKKVDIRSFTNDMVTFESYNDVLTLLIHLGYLGYDFETEEVFIPNKEISDEFVTAVKVTSWNEITTALRASEDLLNATWLGDAGKVAQYIEAAHNETPLIKYNDENALSCIVSIAYYSAREYYTLVREMPAGKGFADLVFLPRKNHLDKPAMIIELKWDKTAAGAIRQIEDKQYYEIINEYKDNALLVGISYNRDTKRHECMIKRFTS